MQLQQLLQLSTCSRPHAHAQSIGYHHHFCLHATGSCTLLLPATPVYYTTVKKHQVCWDSAVQTAFMQTLLQTRHASVCVFLAGAHKLPRLVPSSTWNVERDTVPADACCCIACSDTRAHNEALHTKHTASPAQRILLSNQTHTATSWQHLLLQKPERMQITWLVSWLLLIPGCCRPQRSTESLAQQSCRLKHSYSTAQRSAFPGCCSFLAAVYQSTATAQRSLVLAAADHSYSARPCSLVLVAHGCLLEPDGGELLAEGLHIMPQGLNLRDLRV